MVPLTGRSKTQKPIARTLRTMNRMNEEYVARRTSASSVEPVRSRYDTVPPEKVIDELTRPDGARMVRRSKGAPAAAGRLTNAGAIVLGALILAAAMVAERWQTRPLSV